MRMLLLAAILAGAWTTVAAQTSALPTRLYMYPSGYKSYIEGLRLNEYFFRAKIICTKSSGLTLLEGDVLAPGQELKTMQAFLTCVAKEMTTPHRAGRFGRDVRIELGFV